MRFFTEIPIFHKTAAEVILKSHSLSRLPSGVINAICTNSRLAERADIFFAFEQNRDKAIAHVREARARGAVTVSEIPFESTITVKCIKQAFLDLAAYYKDLLQIKKTIAITGSNGKTTTKDISARLISSAFNTHATKGNFNNEIGVPITIFTAPKDTEILIAEAGMNHKGELSLLSDCLRPDVCVITNVGSAHIGNLGSREQIALAKLEILDGMNEPLLLAPANEPLLEAHRTFSVSYDGTRADFMLNTKLSDQTRAIFDFYSDKLKIEDLTVYATGAHIPPALAFSLSLCSLLGIDEQSLKYAAAELRDSIARSTVKQIGYLTVIDDTYNSSPEAVLCALKTLRLYKNRRISAVLGDMLELGENSEQYHRSIGKACADAGLSRLYTFGKYARVIADGAISGGMRAELISINEDMSARHITAEEIMRSSLEGDVILFKASNAVGLDRVIRILDEKITKGEDSRE